MKHIDDIRTDYRQLLTAFGALHEIVLPTEEQVRQKIPELFTSVQVEQLDVPFTFESARNSFVKTILKYPPSHKSQQFKDGVLWANCLELLHLDDVVLVTEDKAFYQDHDYKKGINAILYGETKNQPHGIRVHPRVADLLEALKTPIAIDANALQDALIAQFDASISGTLERHGFALGERTSFSVNVFATENPAILFLDFQIEIQCDDLRSEERTDAVIRFKGDGSYEPISGEFINLRNFGEQLTFRLPDGTASEVRNARLYVDGPIVFGNKPVSSVVRYALPQNDP